MKKYIIILLLTFGTIPASAQTRSPYEFITRIPKIPDNICSIDSITYNKFNADLHIFFNELREEISIRRKKVKSEVANSKQEIEKNMAEKMGMSLEDAQKLKGKKMSKAEKMALADKMLQEKTGISMKEIENLKKMSKEGKKQWAESYATQQQAMLSGNPDSNKTQEQIEMEKTTKKNANMNSLAQEQKLIMDKIAASDKIFMNKMQELDKKDTIETKKLNKERKPLIDRLNGIPEPYGSAAKVIAAMRKVLSLEEIYCNKLTPIYVDILKGAQLDLEQSLSSYKRLEEINAELNKATLEMNRDVTSSPGLMGLEAIESFTNNLLNVLKYAHYTYTKSTIDGLEAEN